MKDEDSIFGTKPDRLNRLVFEAMGDSESDEQGAPTASLNALMEQLGSQIDRYKLLRVLGEGGMGMVYLAEQEGQIRRRVALKVIKPGMDSARVIARFENERQALALLDHPNIAQIYDAGTTESGRPYFVMEHVKGSPITDYCDHHKLDIEDRLHLFQQVCLAVHHAHQKGIIHRDIKPSNVLVSTEADRALPKIIDFGVAKAMSQPLTKRTLFTEDTHLLGTPEYMSPEQADMAGEDIDTRSDIYSLGVLLYVLLAGILPYDSKTLRGGGVEHIRKVIRQIDPKTPSTRLTKLGEDAAELAANRQTQLAALAKCLRRELEWIPLKAMRKDRSERYRSASELADDIENYLTGAPLIAARQRTGYKVKKFVRRNRVLVGGVVAVLVVLVMGIMVSTVLAVGQMRARSETQLVTDLLIGNLTSASKIKGREPTVVDFLDAAAAKLDKGEFRDRPLVEASIRDRLAYTYFDLGRFALAAQHQKPVYRIYSEQLGEHDSKTGVALNWLAVFYYHAGMYKEAEPLYEQVIEKARRATSGDLFKYRHVWNANLGTTLAGLGRYEEAEHLVRPKVDTDPGLGYGLHLGEIYRELGKYEAADRVLRESLNAGRAQGELEETLDVQFHFCFVRCIHELGLLRLAQGNDAKAEEWFRSAIQYGERELPGKDHPGVLRAVNGLAVVHIRQEKYEEADSLLGRALVGQELKLGPNHPDTLKTIHDFGVLCREQGQSDAAETFLAKALERRQTTLGPDHPHILETVHELGILYVRQARWGDAERRLLQAFRGREARLGPEHPCTIESLNQLVNLYESRGKPTEAAKYRASLAKRQGAQAPD